MKVEKEKISKDEQQSNEKFDLDVEQLSNHSRQSMESSDAENLDPESKADAEEPKPIKVSTKESKDKLHPSFRSIDFVTQNVPIVNEHLKLVKRIGEGTFATVYLAESLANPRFRFALKALVPTVHSSRIENEIRILTMIGGQQNVIRLLSAVRHKDLVYLLMPYVQHEIFGDYFLSLSVAEVKEYMRNLMIALRHIHHFGVIHRDVKPSNFLHNRSRKTYMLVDFGLAHREKVVRCPPEAPRKRPGSSVIFPPKQTHQRLSLGTSSASHPALYIPGIQCRCGDRLTTCRACAALPAMGQGAQRGGTCGYRAPEVVLRYQNQTVAIDVWSAGMIFASFMAGRCPPLFSSSDNDYLHKMVYLCGYERMQAACWQIGRRILVDPAPALDTNVSYSERLSQRLASIRSRTMKALDRETVPNVPDPPQPAAPPPPFLPPPPPPPPVEEQCENCPVTSTADVDLPEVKFPPEAYDLLSRMLDPNPATRITSRETLRHPFLAPSASPMTKE